MYAYGLGVPLDAKLAVGWLRKSADGGCANGNVSLGRMYELGQGVSQSHFEAVNYYQKSAQQSNDTAQLYLGLAYYNGKGVNRDAAKAIEWFRKSALQTNALAQFHLGFTLAESSDAGPEAYIWLAQGLDQLGDQYSGYKYTLETLAARLLPEQISEAQYTLAKKYQKGDRGTPQNAQWAREWFTRSALGGYPEAQYQIGLMYHYGDPPKVMQSDSEALKWFHAAGGKGKGHGGALMQLGESCFKGNSVTLVNLVYAHFYYQSAVVKGVSGASERLHNVEIYMAPKQKEEASDLYKKFSRK